jgi:hypothetical protein
MEMMKRQRTGIAFGDRGLQGIVGAEKEYAGEPKAHARAQRKTNRRLAHAKRH